jgi:glutaryl-CoA dehydrogenase (non-decarboxylating)
VILSHLSPEQAERREEFRAFAAGAIAPHAAQFDREQSVSRDAIDDLADHGLLGALLAKDQGGLGMGYVEYGLLTEELGRACQSVRNFVAVEDMVAYAVARWGSGEQRGHWLPRIASGETLAAFALTEPEVGSDAAAVRTTATAQGDRFVLRGTKEWISFAQLADVFLVFCQIDGQHTAFLVERDTPGLSVEPIGELLGLRASMLGRVTLDGCSVPAGNMVGRPGSGLTVVASGSLDLGRYSTAWGSVGLAQACLEASAHYAATRVQYGTEIVNHQLVQALLTDILTDTISARLLCHHAGVSRERGEVDAISLTLLAKYQASRAAVRAAGSAVQIHGARGIGAEAPVQRYYRDAKVMEIIEGTTEIQQSLLGRFAAQVGRR